MMGMGMTITTTVIIVVRFSVMFYVIFGKTKLFYHFLYFFFKCCKEYFDQN
jgi:hypothetical protein